MLDFIRRFALAAVIVFGLSFAGWVTHLFSIPVSPRTNGAS